MSNFKLTDKQKEAIKLLKSKRYVMLFGGS